MTENRASVELTPVDTSDGVQPFDLAAWFTLDIPGQDKAAYVLGNDLTSEYALSPDSLVDADVPPGQFYRFRWTSHTVYPGVERNVWLYLPHGAAEHPSVNLLVCQDGPAYFGPMVNATTVLDNLIHRGEIPMTAGLFVAPGEDGPGNPFFGGRGNRAIEYDTVNGDYARFLVEELFPVVREHVSLSDDAAGRVICGMSSGGACAATAAFFRPEDFGNVISHCGSFINIRGAHALPSMYRQTPRRAVRFYLQTGSRDLDVIFGNIPIANQDLAASLRYRRYDYRLEFGTGGHSLRHGGAVFPETLRWVFRDQIVDRYAPVAGYS